MFAVPAHCALAKVLTVATVPLADAKQVNFMPLTQVESLMSVVLVAVPEQVAEFEYKYEPSIGRFCGSVAPEVGQEN